MKFKRLAVLLGSVAAFSALTTTAAADSKILFINHCGIDDIYIMAQNAAGEGCLTYNGELLEANELDMIEGAVLASGDDAGEPAQISRIYKAPAGCTVFYKLSSSPDDQVNSFTVSESTHMFRYQLNDAGKCSLTGVQG